MHKAPAPPLEAGRCIDSPRARSEDLSQMPRKQTVLGRINAACPERPRAPGTPPSPLHPAAVYTTARALLSFSSSRVSYHGERLKKKQKKKLGTFPVPSVEQPQPAKPSLQLLDEALFPHHPSPFRDLCWKQRLLHFSCQFHWKKKYERKTNCALWYLGKLSLQGNVIFSSLFDCKCVNLFNCIIDQHSTYNYYHCIMDWKKFAATACVIRYALVTNF